MSYIDNNLLPDERSVFRTKKYLILFLVPAIFFLCSIAASAYMRSNAMLLPLEWAPWVVTLVFWAHAGLQYYFSEYAVTNKRILLREGFVYRHTAELQVATISQVNVEQSLLGQWLNYGSVGINAFGAVDFYHLVADPYGFQRCVNAQLAARTS